MAALDEATGHYKYGAADWPSCSDPGLRVIPPCRGNKRRGRLGFSLLARNRRGPEIVIPGSFFELDWISFGSSFRVLDLRTRHFGYFLDLPSPVALARPIRLLGISIRGACAGFICEAVICRII